MSASTEKKNRQAAREAGTDKKTIALREEAEKKAKSRRRWTWGMIGVVLFIVLVLVANSTRLYTATTAVEIDGKKFSPTDLNYSYANAYYTFYNRYGSYASMFGLDTSKGLAGLASQEYSDGQTWREYFLEQAIDAEKETMALTKYAEENGIELTEEEITEAKAQFDGLDETAKTNGYGNADKFLAANYGTGMNRKLAEEKALQQALATKVYSQVYQEYQDAVTAEEIQESHPSVNVRHILVKAVAEEDGTFTDEAKAEAKAKTEDILAEWEAGEATEESFAALAEQYSEDEGSNTNGGLYEFVEQGTMVAEFNDFCFAEGRKAGDTGIVYGDNGSYAGYHVMYFVGEADPAENQSGREAIAAEKMTAWIEELTAPMEVVKKGFYRFAGKI